MPDRPVVVAYDWGAVSPSEIALGLGKLWPVIFLVPDSDHVDHLEAVLGRLGRTLVLSGDRRHDLARLRMLRPAGLLTFSENLVRTTAELTTALGLPGHSPRTAELLTDKYLQRAQLREAGVDSVRSVLVDQASRWRRALDEIGTPAIVKPARGQGSTATFLVSDVDSLGVRVDGLLAKFGAFVIEEYLTGRPSHPHGDYVSVETASHEGEISAFAVTGKHPLEPPFREVGQFWPPRLPPDEIDAVRELACAAVRALGVRTGICHTEIKLTPAGPRIIEVNGRLGGLLNQLSRQATGIDLVHAAASLATGASALKEYLTTAEVHYQWNSQAPMEPCTLRAIYGADDIREVPGIDGYWPYVRPGDRIAGGVGTTYIDLIAGRAPTHDTMVKILNEALSLLRYEFTCD